MEENLAADFKALKEICEFLVTYEQQEFFQIAQLLRPEWTDADVFEITTKLAHTVNQLLAPDVSVDQLRLIAGSNAPESKSVSLFLNLYGLKNLLSGIPCNLLCNLGAVIPMGDPGQRLNFLLAVQQKFQLWSNSELESLKTEFDKTSPYMQHTFVKDNIQDAHTPVQVCNAIGSLFSFPASDVLTFKSWIESLDGANINIIANLFQFTEDFVLKVWTHLCAPLPAQYGYSGAAGSALGTSADVWGASSNMLTTSFNQPFPHMNASDDGSITDWQRSKKRTAGGSSKHIINLNDSSTAAVSLRLSSSLNAYLPQTKRSAINAMSPPNSVHEMSIPQGSELGTSQLMSIAPSHHHHGALSFDAMLTASEPPMLGDQLRSSNWILPPKFYTEATEETSNSLGSTGAKDSHLAQHFAANNASPAPSAANASRHNAADDLRTASNGLYGLTIAQENVDPNDANAIMAHNASFFPSAPAPTAPESHIHPMSHGLHTPAPVSHSPATHAVGKQQQTNSVGFLNGVRLELRITGAPPAKSVYQRILKPYPVVKVIGADKLVNRVLFLKASLWNADGTSQMTCLDGGLQVAAQPTTATFKKLKVLNTSVQKGTLFKLKFQLEVFGEREQALDLHVWSDPMEVVSHTVYLTNPSNTAPTPATVTETIPNTGIVGSRVVILGSSFLEGDSVRVKFGDIIAHHTYHENGALIAIAPAQPPNTHSRVLVSVSNDGVDYSASNAAYTYA